MKLSGAPTRREILVSHVLKEDCSHKRSSRTLVTLMKMKRIMLCWPLLHGMAFNYNFASGWNPPSPSAHSSKKAIMGRRTILRNHLPVFGSLAATIAFPSVASGAKDDAIMASTSAAVATGIPANVRESTGVLWRTGTGVALPATPNFLSQIVKKEMLGSTDSTGIVCISERHDDFEHHKVQLKVLMTIKKSLQDRGEDASGKLSIGMEMFQRKHQPYLDKYIAAGDTSAGTNNDYTLEDLKRDTDWNTTWGYDILHYLPILMFARKWGIRLLGLHPSDLLVGAVKQHGLSKIPPSIIDDVCTTDRQHKDDFKRLLRQRMSLYEDFGGCEEAMEMEIERRYEVQVFREEYMAESASIQMANKPDGWVVLLAGEMHVLGRNGLPFRALRRLTTRRNQLFVKHMASKKNDISNRGVFTIIPQTTAFPIKAREAPDMSSADYVWYVQRDPSTRFRDDQVNLAPTRNMGLRTT